MCIRKKKEGRKTHQTSRLNSTMKGRKRRSHSSSSSSDSDSDPDFDCNEEDFSCSPTLTSKKSQPKIANANSTQRRKKLTLPKAPKAQRSAEKYRNEEKWHASKTEVDVFDSEDEVLHSNKSKGFDMLVKAAFHNDGGQLTPLDSCPTKGVSITEEGTTKEDCSSEKKTEDYSLPEDKQDDDENENSCADDSDGLGKHMIKQKYSQSHSHVALEQNKMDIVVSHIKKARSKLRHQWTSPVSETIEKNSALPAITPDIVKKSPELLTPEPQKSVKEPVKFTSTKIKAIGEPESDKSSNILRFQSSSVPHRRVLGLSRRVRPAPLHPYLSKTDK